ncbi:MAG: DNA translocase FtsK 4TM domain-containing protein [Clostridia bacterium]
MGKKRTGKSRKKVEKTIGNDMIGGILVVLGLMLTVFLGFENIGIVAEIIKSLLKGLLGNTVFLFPVVLIITGVYSIVADEKVKIGSEIKKGSIVMIFAAIFMYSLVEKNFNVFENIVKFSVDSYNAGVIGANIGGVVGAIFASLFVKFIGVLATQILMGAITFIALLYSFNVSFKQFFKVIGDIFAGIFNGFSRVSETLFRNDEIDDDAKSTIKDDKKDTKISRKQRLAEEKKEKLAQQKMKESGSSNVDENLRVDNDEQIEFDFNKLGVPPSETQLAAKQQRDEFFKKQKEQKEDKDIKEVLTLDHTRHVEQDNYIFPPIKLLKIIEGGEVFDKKEIHATAVKLQKTLASFGVDAKVTNITKGPTVTRYELTPSTGVKVSKIVNLADDIALNLAAKSIRIEAPIPGKAAVGIEVPNKTSDSVSLREVIESPAFKTHKSKLAFSLGKDAAGELVVGDIAKMPHVLVAGATGSGKSVCINSIIISLLYKSKPSEVKLILIDPKMVELSGYNGIPHLLIPVVTDPKKAAGALNWAVQEMVNRYNLFASKGVKDIKGYNKIIEKEEEAKLPQIVIIIDELADLMMVAPNDVEDAICRLAQMARAAGMHLVIATQRPSVDVITGIIKANIPSRIAFTVSSQIDSRTILDSAGAEKLLGKGDMLYFPVGEAKPHRIQGTFISEKEIEEIVEEIKKNTAVTYSEDIIEALENTNLKGSKSSKGADSSTEDDCDEILKDAIDLVVDMGQASASMLQRRFKIGYSRAGRIVDQMEARGLVSGYDGSKPRQVLVSKAEWQELKLGNNNSLEENALNEPVNLEKTLNESEKGIINT